MPQKSSAQDSQKKAVLRPQKGNASRANKPSNRLELDPERFDGRQLTHGEERGMMSGVCLIIHAFHP
jgi:hypothetical protein